MRWILCHTCRIISRLFSAYMIYMSQCRRDVGSTGAAGGSKACDKGERSKEEAPGTS